MAILERALGVEHERASTAPPAARPSRERRSRSDSYRRRGEGQRRLGRATDVAVVEAADVGQGNNAAVLGWLDGARLGCILLKREMRPPAGVVAEVAEQATTKVLLVEDDDMVEQFAPDGADHPLSERERVLPRRTWRGENLGDAYPFHSLPEHLTVGAIAIAQKVARG